MAGRKSPSMSTVTKVTQSKSGGESIFGDGVVFSNVRGRRSVDAGFTLSSAVGGTAAMLELTADKSWQIADQAQLEQLIVADELAVWLGSAFWKTGESFLSVAQIKAIYQSPVLADNGEAVLDAEGNPVNKYFVEQYCQRYTMLNSGLVKGELKHQLWDAASLASGVNSSNSHTWHGAIGRLDTYVKAYAKAQKLSAANLLKQVQLDMDSITQDIPLNMGNVPTALRDGLVRIWSRN